jgi:hypothetical protein
MYIRYPLSLRQVEDRHCQTNLAGPAKSAGLRRSGRQLTPFGQGGRTVLFEAKARLENLLSPAKASSGPCAKGRSLSCIKSRLARIGHASLES